MELSNIVANATERQRTNLRLGYVGMFLVTYQ